MCVVSIKTDYLIQIVILVLPDNAVLFSRDDVMTDRDRDRHVAGLSLGGGSRFDGGRSRCRLQMKTIPIGARGSRELNFVYDT